MVFDKLFMILKGYKIENASLNKAACVKDWGVMFDSSLNFKINFNYVIAKDNKCIRLL